MMRISRVLVACVGLLLIGTAASAQADTKAPQSQEVASQTYQADGFLQKGTIVTLKAKDSGKIVAASTATINAMLGVVVEPGDSPLTLSSQTPGANTTYVATSGRYSVLVSTENGPINVGDYITVSAVNGIGMKTGITQTLILGMAATTFSGKGDSVTHTTITTVTGQQRQVAIGVVQVDINIGQNPFLYHSVGGVPHTLTLISETISGRQNSALRIYASLGVLVVAMCIAASLLYGGIRGSMNAIGRNPLARGSVFRGLTQVITTALIIFVFGLVGVYLILKL